MKYQPGVFLFAFFVSFFIVSTALAGNLPSVPNTFSSGTTASASQVNANFEAVRAAVNDNATTKQNIVSGTCPTGQSIRVINADGSVACEVDDVGAVDFGSILSVVGVTGTSGASSSAQADCPTNEYATGGSCGIPSSTTSAAIKIDEPVVVGVDNPPTGWACTCIAETGQNCTVKASVICAQ